MSTGSGAPHSFPWVGTDLRGHIVILSRGTFLHAAGHHNDFANPALGLPAQPYAAVTATLAHPDAVFENTQRRGAPPRVGHELYCRWVGFVGQFVLVPVKILEAPQSIEGYPAPAGARLACTLYAGAKPARVQLWP